MIQNKRAVLQVLGTIMNEPMLLLNSDYDIQLDDFQESIHKVLFLAVNKLVEQEVVTINAITIDSYLAAYPKQYKVFLDNKGLELVNKLMASAQRDSFKYWYDMLKKYSLLRQFISKGIDISSLYDPNETDVDKIEKSNEKLSKMSVSDVFNHFNEKFLDIRDTWVGDSSVGRSFHAGDGLRALIERLETTPSMGHSFVNPILTTAARGMRKKSLVLISGASGTGKSRSQIANAVHVAIPWLYSTEKKQWVKRDEESKPVLYISTELVEEEIQTIMVAYLSGVDEAHILSGRYLEGERERVMEAIDLIEAAPLECHHIPDFDIKDIESLIERAIIKHKVEYVFYDYLHSTPKILRYYNQATGTHLSEHQILYLFGNSLKALVNKYDIFLYTSTQLNRGYKDEQNLDASAIRGAMSLADKIDLGIISIPPSTQDIEKLSPLIAQSFEKEPNTCHTIYKNRGNRYKNIRIWTRLDLGTMREEILFVTDDRYRRIDIEATIIDLAA